VLHDLPTGAMHALPEFLDALDACDAEVTQELPESVLAIDGGVPGALDGLVRT
jgi:hypothetical protein